MIKYIFIIIGFTTLYIAGCSNKQKKSEVNIVDEQQDLKADSVSAKQLLSWDFYGIGSVKNAGYGQVLLSEDENSKGVMIISPDVFDNNMIISFDIMLLRAASVPVVMLAMSDQEDINNLTLPEDYNGEFNMWYKKNNLLFGIHCAPHNFNPFLRLSRDGEHANIVVGKRNALIPGVYAHIEVGSLQGKLWLKIDGQLIFEGRDNKMSDSGRLSFRVRGTSHETGSYLIKNLVIFSASI